MLLSGIAQKLSAAEESMQSLAKQGEVTQKVKNADGKVNDSKKKKKKGKDEKDDEKEAKR